MTPVDARRPSSIMLLFMLMFIVRQAELQHGAVAVAKRHDWHVGRRKEREATAERRPRLIGNPGPSFRRGGDTVSTYRLALAVDAVEGAGAAAREAMRRARLFGARLCAKGFEEGVRIHDVIAVRHFANLHCFDLRCPLAGDPLVKAPSASWGRCSGRSRGIVDRARTGASASRHVAEISPRQVGRGEVYHRSRQYRNSALD